MGFSLLAPLFLAGTAFLAIPFLLHQIRRPEREPIEFSSLMFVPNIKKEVIERRRIQHILLMLLRMLILLLLVLAFARPVWETMVMADTPEGQEWHTVLIDRSYSMGAENRIEEAIERADEILGSLSSDDRASVIAFDRHPEVLSKLWDPNDRQVGSRSSARQVLDTIELTQETTAYLPALQRAQELYEGLNIEENVNEKWVVHVISDFQSNGMPQNRGDWRLPERFELKLEAVGNEEVDNFALTDMAVRNRANGDLQIVAKIRNGSADIDEEKPVQLILDEEEAQRESLRITPGNSSQISFRLENPQTDRLEGWLQLDEDELALDNRRYFTWNEPRKSNIEIVSDADLQFSRTSTWFLQQAIPESQDLPWKPEVVQPSEAFADPENTDLYLLCDIETLSIDVIEAILQEIEAGGKVFIMLNESMANENTNLALFEPLGFQANGLHRDANDKTQFDLISWVDFEHAIFMPLQGAQFNDFSSILFYNFINVEISENAETLRVLARFEGEESDEGPPAVFESQYGEEKVLVWSFEPNLQMNNFVRSTKFVPILYESFGYLIQQEDEQATHIVGERIELPSAFSSEDEVEAQLPPENSIISWNNNDTILQNRNFREAGFIRWRAADETDWQITEPININAKESNLERVDLDEFRYAFSTAPVIATDSTPNETTAEISETMNREVNEYWRWVFGFLVVCFLFETWFASRFV